MAEITADMIARAMGEAWDGHLHRKFQRPSGLHPLNYVYASQRKRCVRQMALDMMHPEDRDPFDIYTLERFAQGNENEEALLARLAQAGKFADTPFKVVGEQQRFEHKDRSGNVIIVGKVDGEIQFDGGVAVTAEVKSGNAVARCETLADLDAGYYTRHMPDQLLSYMLGSGRPLGVLILRKQMRRPTIIAVNLEDHLERAEQFLVDAERACDARHGRADVPDHIDDPSECTRCPHLGKSCVPPHVNLGEGALLATDYTWAEDVERLVEIQDAGREYARLKRIMGQRITGVVGLKDRTVILPGGVVATTRVIERRGNPNPKPVPPSSYLKVSYEKIRRGSDGGD